MGSGGGAPGLPIAILAGDREVTLIEARTRRADYLRALVDDLGLRNVRVVEERGEVFAADGDEGRERYACAMGRALAKLPVALEILLPLVLGPTTLIHQFVHVLLLRDIHAPRSQRRIAKLESQFLRHTRFNRFGAATGAEFRQSRAQRRHAGQAAPFISPPTDQARHFCAVAYLNQRRHDLDFKPIGQFQLAFVDDTADSFGGKKDHLESALAAPRHASIQRARAQSTGRWRSLA